MALLTKEAILDAEDRKTEEMDIPEWGGSIVIKEFSARERDAIDIAVINRREGGDLSGLRLLWVAKSIIDPETGASMFSPEELAEKNAEVINRIFDRSQKLNVMSVAEAEENFGKGQS